MSAAALTYCVLEATYAAEFLATHLGGPAFYWRYFLWADRLGTTPGEVFNEVPYELGLFPYVSYYDWDLWKFIQKRDPNTFSSVAPEDVAFRRCCSAAPTGMLPTGGDLQVTLCMEEGFHENPVMSPERALKLAKELEAAATYCIGRQLDVSTWAVVEEPDEIICTLHDYEDAVLDYTLEECPELAPLLEAISCSQESSEATA